MTIEGKASGCLLGLASGDALGRPIEFMSPEEIESRHGEVSAMLGHGTHGQPAGTITDDTEMALCIAESLVDRRGFDPADVADRFVHWLEAGPFDIGLMTRDSLSRIRQGTSWHEAGGEVWKSRSEGSNAGNGSVMRCAPHAIAFRHFQDELTHVSRLSSAITHADPRCQWGCVILNRTLANLICDDEDPLGSALKNTSSAPEELRIALTRVHDHLTGERAHSTLESKLQTSGYVVHSLQAGLYFGLTAESVESAIVEAVNRGGDTDTVGAIAGAVAGARFGVTDVPDRWVDEIDESRRIERLAKRLLTIRMEIPDKKYVALDDGSLIFKRRTVEGPSYIPVQEFESGMGNRPYPAPHRTIGSDYHEVTSSSAAMLDWERRAYAVQSGRSSIYTGQKIPLEDDTGSSQASLVPVPQYPFVETFDALPEQDQQWIRRDGRETAEAFVRAYVAFAGIRYPITELETGAIGIERSDPIAGATRVLVGTFGDISEALLGDGVRGGYDSPADIEAQCDISRGEDRIVGQPETVYETTDVFPKLASGAAAILDYVTQLRLPQKQQAVTDTDSEIQLIELRAEARTMVGELNVMYESLRRVAVRHPEVEYKRWRTGSRKVEDRASDF